MSLSYAVSDIGRKLPIVTYPTSIWCPRWGWLSRNFADLFGFRKLESQGYRKALFTWTCV